MAEDVTLQFPASGAETEPSPEPVEAAPDAPLPDEPPKRDRVSERFAKLTRALADKDRDIAQLRQEIAALRPAAPAPEPVAASTGRPRATDFADYDEYVERLAAWQAEQALQARDAKQREQALREQQQQAQLQWQERLRNAQANHPDWDDIIEGSDIRLAPALEEGLLHSEQGPELMYYLAQHPDEAQKLNALPPLRVAQALGRLEASLESPRPAPGQAPPTPSAPRPPAPVHPANEPTAPDPGQMSYQEYKAWRSRQRRR